ncbi:hypothetical protein Patl1_16916 [Pistacia atlantica]|uniref:Uncharacterized protein n=1 Tax=Pistacia atlantica TaxID=434234 RepID=A0ACC1B6F3_9ROSI|nr:hypothetical protein Patl1_16916 [Pistacia atlantica]
MKTIITEGSSCGAILFNGEVKAKKTMKKHRRSLTRALEKKPIKKTPLKDIILSVFHWGGGKVLVLRRFKHKFTIYVIACVPVRLKSPTALISA